MTATQRLKPHSMLDVAKQVVATLLIRHHYVTTRWVMNMSDRRLTQSQARRMLRQFVKIGWMTERRIPSLGAGFTPTTIGRLGFAAVVDEPLLSLAGSPYHAEPVALANLQAIAKLLIEQGYATERELTDVSGLKVERVRHELRALVSDGWLELQKLEEINNSYGYRPTAYGVASLKAIVLMEEDGATP